jgi:hypothetical protein
VCFWGEERKQIYLLTMFLPTGGKSAEDVARKKAIGQVTRWVNECLQSADREYRADKYQVMVTEIQCNDPGCVPIETLVVIILMNQASDTSKERAERCADKILMPVAEVTVEDVQSLVNSQFSSQENEQSIAAATTSTSITEPSVAEVQITRVIMRPNNPPAAADSAVSTSVAYQTVALVASSSATVSKVAAPIVPKSENTLPVPPAPVSVASEPITNPVSAPAAKPKISSSQPMFQLPSGGGGTLASRHDKGSTRPRGCPCCDPDNIDNIVDQLLFQHYPQT